MTLDEARALLADLRPRISELLVIRADLAELRADLAASGSSVRGGLAEAKALEARLYTRLERLGESGAAVKGFAPLLLDIEGERQNVPIVWCWLEGDTDIYWYHRVDTGFAGRRPT